MNKLLILLLLSSTCFAQRDTVWLADDTPEIIEIGGNRFDGYKIDVIKLEVKVLLGKKIHNVKYLKCYWKANGAISYYVDNRGKKYYADKVLRYYEYDGSISNDYEWKILIKPLKDTYITDL